MTDTKTPPVEPVNGELVQRVQQLRLKDQLGNAPRRGGGSSLLPWVLCALMAVGWVGIGVKAYKSGGLLGKPDGTGTAGTNPGTASSTAKPNTTTRPAASTGSVAGSGDILLELKGNLLPAQELAVSPIDVGGRVVELNVVEGKLFKKGEILAKLEDTNYQAMVSEAEASKAAVVKRLDAAKLRRDVLLPESVRKVEVTQAEEELKEAEAQMARALDQYERLAKLAGGVSEQELRQARFDYEGVQARARRLTAALTLLREGPRQEQKDAAEADVRAAEAEVKAADARLQQAQWRLNNCVITAPIDGTILVKRAEIGNLVNPMAFGSTSGAICDMANLADMEVELDVPEREIAKLRERQVARIRADAYPDRTYQGYIDRIMPIADDSKNVIKIRVKVILPEGEIPGRFLKPKMSVVVTLVNEEYKN